MRGRHHSRTEYAYCIGAEVRTAGFPERPLLLFAGADRSGIRASRGGNDDGQGRNVDQTLNVLNLIRRLEKQDATSVVVGCMQILGLPSIREWLGVHWPALRHRALLLAHDTLVQLLGSQNINGVVDDSSSHIRFASSDDALARARVKQIPALAVRTMKRGFALRLAEVQHRSTVETALQTPVTGDNILNSLRLLQQERPKGREGHMGSGIHG